MIDNKIFAMFFNGSPRKGWNTHKLLEAANAHALGKRLMEMARTHV
jgi:multimeric flavodoxin WrbA